MKVVVVIMVMIQSLLGNNPPELLKISAKVPEDTYACQTPQMTDSAGWTRRPLLRTDAAASSSPTPLTLPCCLQPDHMHLNGDTVPAAAAAQQDGSREWVGGRYIVQ